MSELMDAAKTARQSAYAPYSHYLVGAAVRSEDGRIWAGCNVENISYPQGVCAEKNALAAMVLGGNVRCIELALFTRDGGTPCGGCLQAMLEFAAEPSLMKVYIESEGGAQRAYTLSELLPYGFRSNVVG